jgi:hypothetical protein
MERFMSRVCGSGLLAGRVGGVEKFCALSSILHGRRLVLNHRIGVRGSVYRFQKAEYLSVFFCAPLFSSYLCRLQPRCCFL